MITRVVLYLMGSSVLLVTPSSVLAATFFGPSPYAEFGDSPFAGTSFSYFHLENFEDDSFNEPGVSPAHPGAVIQPGDTTDSVDEDDGVIDQSGTAGHSYNPYAAEFTLTFDGVALGSLPTCAGVVWTDVGGDCEDHVEFEAFDSTGMSLGTKGPKPVGDGSNAGGTAEDRFFGVYHPGGISRIILRSVQEEATDWKIDHVQYGRADGGGACEPGWIHNPANDRCFRLTDTAMTWEDAESEAVNTWGAHLATLRSAAEETWLQNTFGTDEWLWIGMHQHPDHAGYSEPRGGWEWSSGEEVIYTNWYPGEPNGTLPGENYAAINYCTQGCPYPDGWFDDYSWTESRGIIERRASIHDESVLAGVVVEVDAQGLVRGPLGGATVTVTDGPEEDTSEDGQFSFDQLDPGPLTLTVSKPGYHAVSRELNLLEGQTRHETFQLLTESSGDTPGAFDFRSPSGNHLIEGMPGDVTFEVAVAWNGSPGSVFYHVNGVRVEATVSELGGGLAQASLTLAAPSAVGLCSEVQVEVVNGEGETTWFDTGVHVSPIPGIVIPWYQDNIWWTLDGATLSHSYEISHDWDLPIGGEDLELTASLGATAGLGYDLLGATFSGTLAGAGGLEFECPVPGHGFNFIGGAEVDLSGHLDISLAGCDDPEVTAGWEASFTGKAGVGAAVVLAVDVIFPPAAPAVHGLLIVPVVREVVGALKVKVYVLGGVAVAGEYFDSEGSPGCFLGADELTISGMMGIEAQAALELFGAEAGVYAGGTGTPEFEICPDLEFNSVKLRAYVGVFAKSWLFKHSTEVGAELCFGDCGKGLIVNGVLVDEPSLNGKWRPIGSEALRWGDANRIANGRARRLPGSDSIEKSGRVLEETLVENVTQLAEPSLLTESTETHVTFAMHDPDKPWHQATDIASIRSVGGAPWTMERIADDSVADFGPALDAVDGNSDLAVWEQVDGDVSAAEDPGDVAPHLEIAASWFDRATEQWAPPVLVVDNDVVDRAPHPTRMGSRTGVIWIQNEADASLGHATSGDRLMFAEWDGSDWSAPQMLWSGPNGILGHAFISDYDGEGHLVFAVDQDGDLDTTADRELYGVETADGIWQSAVRLTDDTVEDALPVLVAPDGEIICVWASGATVMYTEFDVWDPRPVYAEDTLANEAPSLDGVTMRGGAAIAYASQGPEGVDIVAAFYDLTLDTWSLPRQLTQDEHAESALSLACDGVQLAIAYLKTQTERNAVDIEFDGEVHHLEDVPQPGRTDLCLLKHTLGHDLAVEADSLVIEPPNPEPGTSATIRATVENRGEQVAQSVEYAFYDGDPDGGGTLIGTVETIPDELIGGSSADVSVVWEVPSFPMSHEIYVVADPTLGFLDRDRGNNSTSIDVVLPDLAIENCWNSQVSYTSVALMARVTNPGVIPTGSFELSWRLESADGPGDRPKRRYLDRGRRRPRGCFHLGYGGAGSR